MADSEKSLLKRLPNEVKNVDDMNRVKDEFKDKLNNAGSGFFSGIKKWNYKRQINKFSNDDVKLFEKGTHGENKVIEELIKLDDNYHVLCGVRCELPYFVTHRGKKNLKSAQMDLVVVCEKGVFMIEVKNYSDRYAQTERNSLSPHEQTERAGKVLWIYLQGVVKNIVVTNVLLSIKGNLGYDRDYRSVFVSSLDKINDFIQSRENIYYEDEVEKIVKKLKKHVTV